MKKQIIFFILFFSLTSPAIAGAPLQTSKTVIERNIYLLGVDYQIGKSDSSTDTKIQNHAYETIGLHFYIPIEDSDKIKASCIGLLVFECEKKLGWVTDRYNYVTLNSDQNDNLPRNFFTYAPLAEYVYHTIADRVPENAFKVGAPTSKKYFKSSVELNFRQENKFDPDLLMRAKVTTRAFSNAAPEVKILEIIPSKDNKVFDKKIIFKSILSGENPAINSDNGIKQ